MILACKKYQAKISQLAETEAVLTHFYTQQRSFWQTFIDRMQAFENNLTELRTDRHIFSVYQRLAEIMSMPCPFPAVAEVERLLPEVYLFHQQIEKDKLEALRTEALATTEKMVKKLIALFDTFESDLEYRNISLLEIRKINKKIRKSADIQEINRLFNDAKDMFVEVIEDV